MRGLKTPSVVWGDIVLFTLIEYSKNNDLQGISGVLLWIQTRIRTQFR